MTTTREYTWKDLEDAVGKDFSDGQLREGAEPLDWSAIRRYCEPVEMDFPLFFDDAVAKKHGHKGIICPASYVQTLTSQPLWKPGDPTRWPASERNYRASRGESSGDKPLPMPKTTAAFATDRETETLLPVYIGDRISARGRKLISVAIRETSVGHGAFMIFENEWLNQKGELVALSRSGVYQYNPHPKDYKPNLPPDPDRPKAPTGQREVPEARASYMDWSKQRYYEDVNVGDLVTPVTFHQTLQRLVYEAGSNRDFNAIHHNDEVARGQGAPAMFANNGYIQAMWERVYREFYGLDGWIQKVGPFRMRIFNIVGDPVVVRGKVARKWQEKGKNWVELEMWSENSRGISVGPGPVLGTLPSKPKK